MLDKNTKIVVCCQGGKIRSIHAKYLLNDKYGYRNLITMGLENTADEAKKMLCEWADIILIVATDNLISGANFFIQNY